MPAAKSKCTERQSCVRCPATGQLSEPRGEAECLSLPDLRRRVAELASLNAVSQRITGILSLEELVRSVLDAVQDCVGPEIVLLFLRRGRQLIPVGVRCRQACFHREGLPNHRVGACLCGLAVKDNQPLYSADIHQDPRCTWDECKEAGVRSFAALPLTFHGRVLGVLGVASKTRKRDFASQSEFLETLANGVASALQNAELYEKLRRKSGALARSEKGLRELSGRLLTAQEEERRRIARELHDDVNQRLALLAVELDLLVGELSGKDIPIERISQQAGVARSLASDIHRLSYSLHPSALAQVGLGVAAERFCKEISRKHAIPVEFAQERLPEVIPADTALCAYRVLQEAVTNAVRHSGAESVVVKLVAGARAIRLSVIDFGAGFNPDATSARKGLGLVSMRERLRLVGGHLSIDSAPGQGTRIEADLPCKRAARSARPELAGLPRRPSGGRR
jgi:signal transduction histidine kinase